MYTIAYTIVLYKCVPIKLVESMILCVYKVTYSHGDELYVSYYVHTNIIHSKMQANLLLLSHYNWAITITGLMYYYYNTITGLMYYYYNTITGLMYYYYHTITGLMYYLCNTITGLMYYYYHTITGLMYYLYNTITGLMYYYQRFSEGKI